MPKTSAKATTEETKVELNGGVLVRAPKICQCKVPEVKKNDIQAGDEWTCSCGQGWRARTGKVFEMVDGAEEPVETEGIRWKRISTRVRKPRTPKPAITPTTET